MCAPEFSDLEISIWQEYQAQGLQVIGISNEPLTVIENFIEDQGVTFPVLRDNQNVYSAYNIPGGPSPYPRDFIIDADGVVHLAKTEYDPGEMINVIETLLGNTAASEDNDVLPQSFSLSVYPNPFNFATTFHVTVASSGYMTLTIMDLLGKVVAIPFTGNLPAGSNRVEWNTRNRGLSSGVYFAVLESDQAIWSIKFILLK
ncbi:MAG: redoxin domain-containing protein [Fidelibacterota bacterium]